MTEKFSLRSNGSKKPLDRAEQRAGERKSETCSSVPMWEDLREITISLGHSHLTWKILRASQATRVVRVQNEAPHQMCLSSMRITLS